MTEYDVAILRSILELQLSAAALQEMKLNTNSNSCESINRSINLVLPKNKTYPRTGIGKVSAVIHGRNNQLDKSVFKKLHASKVPLNKNSGSVQVLKKMKNQCAYHKSYNLKPEVKARRKSKKFRLTRKHFAIKHSKQSSSDYRKHQLEPVLHPEPLKGAVVDTKGGVRGERDHSYIKPASSGHKHRTGHM